jgi:hypothetical protein
VESLKVCRRTILRNADNLAVWFYFDRHVDSVSHAAKVALLQGEIQSVCKDHIGTLDDSFIKKNPRPNPTPRVFIEQGDDLSRVLWLSWE